MIDGFQCDKGSAKYSSGVNMEGKGALKREAECRTDKLGLNQIKNLGQTSSTWRYIKKEISKSTTPAPAIHIPKTGDTSMVKKPTIKRTAPIDLTPILFSLSLISKSA